MTHTVLLLKLGTYAQRLCKVVDSCDNLVAEGVLVVPTNNTAAHVILTVHLFCLIWLLGAQHKMAQYDSQVCTIVVQIKNVKCGKSYLDFLYDNNTIYYYDLHIGISIRLKVI